MVTLAMFGGSAASKMRLHKSLTVFTPNHISEADADAQGHIWHRACPIWPAFLGRVLSQHEGFGIECMCRPMIPKVTLSQAIRSQSCAGETAFL